MVERTHYTDVLRSTSPRRGTAGAVHGSRDSGVVRAKTLGIAVVGTRYRSLPFYSAFRTPHSAFYVYRAPLPLRLLVLRRRFSPRAARAHRVAARLPRPRAHRPPWAVRLDGIRARSETARSSGDHRRGAAPARALKDRADSARLGVVASGSVHYHRRERHRLHDVLVAIRHRTTLDGSHDVRHANSEFFLRPPEEVEALFPDCPDAVASTLVLAERFRGVDLTRGLGDRFPDFHGAERAPAPRALAELCRARLEERYPVDSLHRGEAERRRAEAVRPVQRH